MPHGQKGLDENVLMEMMCHFTLSVKPDGWLVCTVSHNSKQTFNGFVSLRLWDLPLGVKPAVYLQQRLYSPASNTQALASVRKHPAEPKTDLLCVHKAGQQRRPFSTQQLLSAATFKAILDPLPEDRVHRPFIPYQLNLCLCY